MTANADSQIAAFLERLPRSPTTDDFQSGRQPGPRALFRGALELTHAQEEAVVNQALDWIEKLRSEQGLDEMSPDSQDAPLDPHLDAGGLKHMQQRSLWDLVYHQRFDWRRRRLGGIYAEGQNIHVPLTRRIVQQMIARATNYFFSTEPWLAASPVGVDDVDMASAANEWAQYQFTQARVKGSLEKAVELAFIRGECVVKTQHVERADHYETWASIAIHPRTGEPILADDGDYIFEDDVFSQDLGETDKAPPAAASPQHHRRPGPRHGRANSHDGADADEAAHHSEHETASPSGLHRARSSAAFSRPGALPGTSAPLAAPARGTLAAPPDDEVETPRGLTPSSSRAASHARPTLAKPTGKPRNLLEMMSAATAGPDGEGENDTASAHDAESAPEDENEIEIESDNDPESANQGDSEADTASSGPFPDLSALAALTGSPLAKGPALPNGTSGKASPGGPTPTLAPGSEPDLASALQPLPDDPDAEPDPAADPDAAPYGKSATALESLLSGAASGPGTPEDADAPVDEDEDPHTPGPGGRTFLLKRDGRTRMPASGLKFERRKIRRRLVQFSGPEVRVCHYRDVLIPLQAADVQQAECVVEFYDIPAIEIVEQYIQRLERQGLWDAAEHPRVLEMLRGATGRPRHGTAATSRPRPELGEAAQGPLADRGDPVIRVAECCLWMDADQDGRRENIVVMIDLDTKQPILMDYVANVYEGGRRPWHVIRINPVDGRWHGISMLDVLWQLQKFGDLCLARWELSVSRSGRFICWHPELTVEGDANPDLELNGGRVWRKKDPRMRASDIVDVVDLHEFKGASLEALLQLVMQMMTNMSGVASPNDAAMAGLDTAKLATGVRHIDKSGQEQFAPLLSHLQEGIEAACAECLMLCIRHAREEEVFHVLGAQGALLVKRLALQDLRRFAWNVALEMTRYKSEQEVQQAQSATQAAMQYYELTPELRLRLAPLFRQQLKAFGVRNTDTIIVLPEKSEMQAENPATPPGTHPGSAPGAPGQGEGAGGPLMPQHAAGSPGGPLAPAAPGMMPPDTAAAGALPPMPPMPPMPPGEDPGIMPPA